MKSPNCRKDGFTLVEAVVAAALLSLLVAASYIAVSMTMYSARLMAQRVTAQGMCMALYEDMHAQTFDMVFSSDDELAENSDAHYVEDRRQYMMAQGLGPGSSDFEIAFNTNMSDKAENYIANAGTAANIPPYKEITISCSWVFKPPFASSTQSGVHTEELRGAIFDIQPRNSENSSLSINHLDLNPSFDVDNTVYAIPQYLRIVDENGIVYTKENLKNGTMPSSLNAVSVAVTPGGGGEQNIVVSGDAKVKNDKRYSFFSNGQNAASYISVQINQSGGKYFMNLYSSDATCCIQ